VEPGGLEQRIARIHRMGQTRPVQGSIRGKGHHRGGHAVGAGVQTLAIAGILDGGSGEISLGGSRLNRFMKDVENVTGIWVRAKP